MILRQKGGKILGKRGGASKNLTWKAIADRKGRTAISYEPIEIAHTEIQKRSAG
jgi:hypothetical protein